MKKVFPPPPRVNNRDGSARAKVEAECPFGDPHTHNPHLNDDEFMGILKVYLRPEQFANRTLLLFIFAYLECRNVAQAGREVGLSNPAYWRSKPEVHAAIEAITVKQVMKYGYDAHEAVARAHEIATIDPVVFQNPDGSFKAHMSEIPPEARRAIKKFKAKNLYEKDPNGIDRVVGQMIEVELWDKLKGIELLGREKNIFKQTTVHEHDVTENMKSVLLESGNRAESRMKALAARDVTEVADGTERTETGRGDSGWSGDGVSVGEQGGSSTGDGSSPDLEIGQGSDHTPGDQGSV